MPYCDHERFQVHCRYCFRQFESDSIEEAIAKAKAHEAERVNGVCQRDGSCRTGVSKA
jgi:hypothetical protein